MLTLKQGTVLIRLARDAITTSFSGKALELEEAQEFSDKQGVFVTLHRSGELRGCIGFPEPVYPLYKAVVHAARAAAFEDPRFPQLEQYELELIDMEVSVLTVPQLIEVKKPEEYVKKITIGIDGLIIRSTRNSGLLLPQVAPEWNWNALQFLEETCRKAGLPRDAWKDVHTKVYKFQAQIFAEEKPKGKVIEKEM